MSTRPTVPFTSERPLDFKKDHSIWVDRETEGEALRRRLHGGKWVALLGQEGMGRTSFLHWLASPDGGAAPGTVPILLYLSSVRPDAPEGPIRGLATALRQGVKAGPFIPEATKAKFLQVLDDPEAGDIGSLNDLRRRLLGLAEQCSGGTLLWILDDADLADPVVRHVAFPVFRALHEDCLTHRHLSVRLILSGINKGPWLCESTEGASPLGNVLVESSMQPLEFRQVENLAVRVGKELGIRIESQAIGETLKLTSGVPAMIQKLLYDVFDYVDSHRIATITSAIVRICAGLLRSDSLDAELRDIAGRLSNLEVAMKSLTQIAESQRAAPSDDIISVLRGGLMPTGARKELGTPGEQYYQQHEETILREHPDKWVAVTAKGVIAAQTKDAELAEQLTELELHGQAPYIVFVRATKPEHQ